MNLQLEPYTVKDGEQKFPSGPIYVDLVWATTRVANHPGPFWLVIDQHVQGKWSPTTPGTVQQANDLCLQDLDASDEIVSLWNVPCLGGLLQVTTTDAGGPGVHTFVDPVGQEE